MSEVRTFFAGQDGINHEIKTRSDLAMWVLGNTGKRYSVTDKGAHHKGPYEVSYKVYAEVVDEGLTITIIPHDEKSLLPYCIASFSRCCLEHYGMAGEAKEGEG